MFILENREALNDKALNIMVSIATKSIFPPFEYRMNTNVYLQTKCTRIKDTTYTKWAAVALKLSVESDEIELATTRRRTEKLIKGQ